jgi:hypothetical protein
VIGDAQPPNAERAAREIEVERLDGHGTAREAGQLPDRHLAREAWEGEQRQRRGGGDHNEQEHRD